MLLQNKADPNLHDGWTPLPIAAIVCWDTLILLKWGASINAQGVTPVYIASQEGHSNVVSLLIRKQQVQSTSPLMIACQNGHFEVVQLLQKANVPQY